MKKLTAIKGISYLTDEQGNKIALVVDIKKHAVAVEDFLDGLETEQRKKEPKENFGKAVSHILKNKKMTHI